MKYLNAVLLLAVCSCSQIPFESENSVLSTIPGSVEKQALSSSVKATEPLTQVIEPVKEIQTAVPKPAPPIATDLWQRMRSGFVLNQPENQKQLERELAWYGRNQAYLDRVANRARRYLYFIVEQLEQRDLPLELALLPVVESAFDPFAYSHGRAMGMWQFIPGTGKFYGLKQNWWYDGRRDVIASTNAALDYLEDLHAEFDQDWELALAAYNSGAGNVRVAIRKNRRVGKPTDFWSLSLPRETRSYVPRLLAIARLVRNPDQYNIRLQPIPNSAYWTQVDAASQIDLVRAAQLAEIDIDEVYLLNPGFNQWATPPDGPHLLLLPLTQATVFEMNLQNLEDRAQVGWQRHKVRWGESLGELAIRYHTRVNIIREVNGIKGNMIRAGDSLLIPVAIDQPGKYALSMSNRQESKLVHLEKRYGRPPISYTVKANDSLWTISRAFSVNIRALAKWNAMATTDTLRVGRVLNIFEKTSSTSAPKRPVSMRKLKYKVRNGDSLSRIASKFNISVNNIRGWNDQLTGEKYLQPGDLLTLFVDVRTAGGF